MEVCSSPFILKTAFLLTKNVQKNFAKIAYVLHWGNEYAIIEIEQSNFLLDGKRFVKRLFCHKNLLFCDFVHNTAKFLRLVRKVETSCISINLDAC